jgi:hypothetical protein
MTPHDPVEEFFARERREVRDLPSGPDHWEGILSESHRPARRGWLPYLGAAAAAAVVVGAIAYGTTGDRHGHPDGHGPGHGDDPCPEPLERALVHHAGGSAARPGLLRGGVDEQRR